MIVLVGIVVNNAIILIDYTNLLRAEEALSTRDALIAAGQRRLRPILMTTTIVTLFLVPAVYYVVEHRAARP
jgi:multidrug efflux pump subunit AcrB